MGSAVNDKEVDVFGAFELMEEFDFLAHPFRLGRIRRTDDDEVFGGLQPFLQFFGEATRLYVGRGEEYRVDRLALPAMLAAQCGRHLVVLQLLL